MRMTSLQLRMLLASSVVVAWNETSSLVRDSIEILKSIGKIPVFLGFSEVSSSEMHSWILETPISGLVAKSRCFESSGVYRCIPEFMYLLNKRDLKNVVFFVHSCPEDVLLHLNSIIDFLHGVRVMVILSHEEDVPRNSMSCSFIWITDTTVDVPDENCIRGGSRARMRGISEDTLYTQDESRYLKNIVLVISVYGYDSADTNAYIRYPEAVAYVNALPVLNVTPVFTKKNFQDVIIEPAMIFTELFGTYDIGAVYTCFGHGFFSKRVRSNSFNVISWWSLLALLAALIFIGATITASFWFTRNVFPSQSCRVSDLLLFLVSSSVGRSPVPLYVTEIPFRALVLLWLFGTFIIGAYVQSQITSEYSVPAYSPAVETVDDLERMTSTGIILPCVDTMLGATLVHFKQSATNIFETLVKLIDRQGELCVYDNEECYSKARDNTHVYIAPLEFAKKQAAREWGLTLGKEELLTYCSVAPARKDFRYVRQHRRLVLALAETGLTLFEERRRTWNHTKEPSRTVAIPFTKQFQVLIYGCSGSCLTLLFELVFRKMTERKYFRAGLQ